MAIKSVSTIDQRTQLFIKRYLLRRFGLAVVFTKDGSYTAAKYCMTEQLLFSAVCAWIVIVMKIYALKFARLSEKLTKNCRFLKSR